MVKVVDRIPGDVVHSVDLRADRHYDLRTCSSIDQRERFHGDELLPRVDHPVVQEHHTSRQADAQEKAKHQALSFRFDTFLQPSNGLPLSRGNRTRKSTALGAPAARLPSAAAAELDGHLIQAIVSCSGHVELRSSS